MVTCSGMKADGFKDDCKCDLCLEEINNPSCVNVGCGHHKGQHSRRPASELGIRLKVKKIYIDYRFRYFKC